ncbi:unnamed protein product [Paramecium pentaurelia]|uniref:Uncharacterized protein n=1 Tax=Paramecium pentaurelia TaxID=43138 RepID=A0A8S1WS29_9CILI|nr:unnamed protein product [Paramecium pentaurelia]
MQSLYQMSPKSTSKNRQQFQTCFDYNESPFLSPKVESFEQHKYRVRTLKPKTFLDGDLARVSKSRNALCTNTNECIKCKGEKGSLAIKLCNCLDTYYHIICILDYANLHPKLGLNLFRCQNCNDYFPIQINEKLSISNLNTKEKFVFLMSFSFLCSLITLEIMVIALFELEHMDLILLIILIIIELLVLLIIISKFYHLCYLIEYDIKEFKLGQEYNQSQLELFTLKIVKQLQYKRAKRVIFNQEP